MPSLKPIRLRGEPVRARGRAPRRLNPSTIQRRIRVHRVRRISWRSASSAVSGCSASMVMRTSPWLRSGSSRSLDRNGIVDELARPAVDEPVALVEQRGADADDDGQVVGRGLGAEDPRVDRRVGRVAPLRRVTLHQAGDLVVRSRRRSRSSSRSRASTLNEAISAVAGAGSRVMPAWWAPAKPTKRAPAAARLVVGPPPPRRRPGAAAADSRRRRPRRGRRDARAPPRAHDESERPRHQRQVLRERRRAGPSSGRSAAG